MNNILLLFVKLPVQGQVKTRLAKLLGDSLAVDLYRSFVSDILNTLQNVNVPVRVCYYPENADKEMRLWLGKKYDYISQIGKSLGERLQHCIEISFNQGADKCIVLGSDIPEISVKIIRDAFASLDDNDAVIGPSFDGGYYLLGFRKKSYITEVFDDISWSTNRVFDETLTKMETYQLTYDVLEKTADIDTFEDYRQFLIRKSIDLSSSYCLLNRPYP